MSGNVFKVLGIDFLENNPELGVLVKLTHDSYRETKKKILAVLDKLCTTSYWSTGSSGSWDESSPYFSSTPTLAICNDIDVWIDSTDIAKKLNLNTDDEKHIRRVIAEELGHFYCVRQKGNIVHVAFPAGYDVYSFDQGKNLHAYYQVDLVIVANAGEIVPHHQHEYTLGSQYSGYHKISAISSLVNTVPGFPSRTFKYSAFAGSVVNRNTGQVVASKLDDIAALILGKSFSAKDLRSVDSIVKILGINHARLAQFTSELHQKSRCN